MSEKMYVCYLGATGNPKYVVKIADNRFAYEYSDDRRAALPMTEKQRDAFIAISKRNGLRAFASYA